jgi:transposase InsO family protein
MRSTGARVIRTPVRAPQANAFAERFIRTARAECLDWVLIRGERHLDRVRREFVAHYNHERPPPGDRPRGTGPPLDQAPVQEPGRHRTS